MNYDLEEVEDTQPDPEELNLESIATDAAYAMKQLRLAQSDKISIAAWDSIQRAIDAIERIQDYAKPKV